MFRALSILNSFFFPVLLAYFIETLPLIPSPSETTVGVLWWNALHLLLVAIKTLFYGAVFGVLVEIISGENLLSFFSRLKFNALHIGSLWLFLYTLRLLMVSLLPDSEQRYLLLTVLDGFFLVALALGIVLVKYRTWLGQPVKWGSNLITILFLVGFYTAAVYFLHHLLFNLPLIFKSAITFASIYLYFLLFISVADRIVATFPKLSQQFMSSKELYLINPTGGAVLQSLVSLILRSYPAIFIILRAFTPAGYKIQEFDRIIWRRQYYKGNVLVAITCYSTNSPEAYKIAKEFKKRGSTVIMGGPHVTYLPEEALAFCDSVIIGSAEGVWEKVIEDYEQGRLQKIYLGYSHEKHYDRLQQFLLTQPYKYIRSFLETTRGCKFQCDFCTIPLLGEKRYYLKPVHQIAQLVEKLPQSQRKFEFLDANIFSDPSYAKMLFEALKPFKARWYSQSTIDIARNPDTLKAAYEGGCRGMLIGFEITEDSPEKEKGGKLAMSKNYLQFAKNIKRAKISIKGHFIFGFNSQNLMSIFQLWGFCLRVWPNVTALFLLTPTPGSQLYFEMLKNKQIMTLNWRRYNYWNMVWQHPKINRNLLNGVFPLMYVLFFLTTSSSGIFILFAIIVFWMMGLPAVLHQGVWSLITFLF